MATFVINLANATDKVDIIGCTMAYNLVDAYKGSGGLSVVKGAARIRDSIFYGNGRTAGGYWLNDGTVVKDAETPTSAALDAGDPAAVYDLEPWPHGNRVNMRFYGNTPYATRSKHGGALIVR